MVKHALSLYHFRPFTRDDLSMMAEWLRTPEVVEWWGKPERELALVTEDLENPQMQQWIVEYEQQPFAYVQAYPVHAWPQPHFASLPAGAMAVDAFVGVPHMVGRGHGGRFLRALAERLIAEGAPVVAIDPDVENVRARRAYARAGFVGDTMVESADGPVVLMVFQRSSEQLTTS